MEPNVGRKWVKTWTPLLLTLGIFILAANAIGLIPIFDVLSLINHTVLHLPEESFMAQVLHGGTTATGNFNVTAALATITFFTIIIAGARAHGFVQHWKNMVPHGLPLPVTIMLIPIEVMGMFVRPFALTMRLAANMTGGHIAILAILSFVFIFTELSGQALVGIGVGVPSVVLAGPAVGARDHRRGRSGIRVHAVVGCVHRHGHSRSSLSVFGASTRTRPTKERRMEGFALAYMGAGIGLGLAVIGAGLGIGRLAAGAAEAIGRQPSATAQITGAVNLPLFLLEGVAILAEVFALLIVLMK